MANELSASYAFAFRPTGGKPIERASEQRVTISDMDYVVVRQTIGTSVEALAIGDITSPRWLWVRNLDTTNYVKIRSGSGGSDFLRIEAGQDTPGIIPIEPTMTLYAIANSAAVTIDFIVLSA